MKQTDILKAIVCSDSCICTWCDTCPFRAKEIIRECLKKIKPKWFNTCPGDLCTMELLYGASHTGYFNTKELMDLRKYYAKLALKKGIKYIRVYLRNPYLAKNMWWRDTKTDW